MIRALIADDEPPARRKLRRMLEAAADVAVVGEAGTGVEAVTLLRRSDPDVAFLDIRMPGLDGFEVVEALGDCSETEVVFVTAYDEHAVRAFEVQALDYLLKPVAEERLAAVLGRLRGRPAGPRPPSPYWKRILVSGARGAHFLAVDEIDWIEADRNYLVLHCGSRERLVRATMGAFVLKLNPNDFARTSRSTAVNLARVRAIRPTSHGDYRVTLADGRELPWSRRYAAGLERFRSS